MSTDVLPLLSVGLTLQLQVDHHLFKCLFSEWKVNTLQKLMIVRSSNMSLFYDYPVGSFKKMERFIAGDQYYHVNTYGFNHVVQSFQCPN